jgi:hypothetical protein
MLVSASPAVGVGAFGSPVKVGEAIGAKTVAVACSAVISDAAVAKLARTLAVVGLPATGLVASIAEAIGSLL